MQLHHAMIQRDVAIRVTPTIVRTDRAGVSITICRQRLIIAVAADMYVLKLTDRMELHFPAHPASVMPPHVRMAHTAV